MPALPPIFYYYFHTPLPYAPTLALQNAIHNLQLVQRRASASGIKDILLLLEHRPVYTAGRRQTEDDIKDERKRLKLIGADFVSTSRGGELTYHGPGQLVGYPLVDLSRWLPAMSVRDYVCRIQKVLKQHLETSHGIIAAPSDNTGIFLDDGDGRGAKTKIASIGVQVRHRLTTHGFSLNVTREPLAWFDQVVACGLADVSAGCIAGRSRNVEEASVRVEAEVPKILSVFERIFERDVVEFKADEKEGEFENALKALEGEALQMHEWPSEPVLPDLNRLQIDSNRIDFI